MPTAGIGYAPTNLACSHEPAPAVPPLLKAMISAITSRVSRIEASDSTHSAPPTLALPLAER